MLFTNLRCTFKVINLVGEFKDSWLSLAAAIVLSFKAAPTLPQLVVRYILIKDLDFTVQTLITITEDP